MIAKHLVKFLIGLALLESSTGTAQKLNTMDTIMKNTKKITVEIWSDVMSKRFSRIQ